MSTEHDMSTEYDRASHRSVNAEVPVDDPDPGSMGTPDHTMSEPPEPARSDRPAEPAVTSTDAPPLLDPKDLDRFRAQWRELQGAFVDSPQEAVTRADSLVTETLEQITTTFAQRKQRLDEQWSRGQDGDTEDLRQALRGYRDYFDRLLTI